MDVTLVSAWGWGAQVTQLYGVGGGALCSQAASARFDAVTALLRASLPLPVVASVLAVAEPSAPHAWHALAQPWRVAMMPRPADAKASPRLATDVRAAASVPGSAAAAARGACRMCPSTWVASIQRDRRGGGIT